MFNPSKLLGSLQQSVPLDIQIMDGAEIFLERRIDNLRTERRISLHGAKNGSAVDLPMMLK